MTALKTTPPRKNDIKLKRLSSSVDRSPEQPPAPSVGRGGAKATEKAAVRRLTIDESADGQRLDNFLATLLKGVPKSHLYRLIRTGEVRVNAARSMPDYRLQLGDQLRLPPMRLPAVDAAAPSAVPLTLPILHEDEQLMAVAKPAGLAVHGGSGIAAGVIERLRAARPEQRFLELVHRLDRETSGVLLLAKRRSALVALHAQWRASAVVKHYRAIIIGRWPMRTRLLAFPLQKMTGADGQRFVKVAAGGITARSRVTGLRRAGRPPAELTEVRVELLTGRTHQIRVHLAHAGHPLVGDAKYGDFDLNKKLQRFGFTKMFLHAEFIEFIDPVSGQKLTLRAPLPERFEQLLAWWGDHDAG